METFTFAPNWGMKLSKEPKVKTITFGDGYEQRLKQGLNHNLRSYSLTFSGDINQMQQIEAFLDRHEGYKAFCGPLTTPRKVNSNVQNGTLSKKRATGQSLVNLKRW